MKLSAAVRLGLLDKDCTPCFELCLFGEVLRLETRHSPKPTQVLSEALAKSALYEGGKLCRLGVRGAVWKAIYRGLMGQLSAKLRAVLAVYFKSYMCNVLGFLRGGGVCRS